MHVPKDDDEWLLFETSRLTEFTRLFPPMPSSKKTNPTSINAATTTTTTTPATTVSASGSDVVAGVAEEVIQEGDGGDDDGDEEEDDDGEGGGVGGAGGGGSAKNLNSAVSAGSNKFKPASYYEILCQVLLCIIFRFNLIQSIYTYIFSLSYRIKVSVIV